MVILTVITALAVPAIVLMIRGAVKWTNTENEVKQLVDQVRELVADKKETEQNMAQQVNRIVGDQGKIHSEIYEQMRIDRDATDRRLRFIEEYWMKKGQKPDD